MPVALLFVSLALAPEPRPARTDGFGDPLPVGAVARFGSVRWKYDAETRELLFSPDGRTLVQVHDRNSFTAWDYPSGRARLRFQFPRSDIPGVSGPSILERPPVRVRFAPDGRSVLALGGLGDLYRVSLADGSYTRLRTIEPHLVPMDVSADGRRIVAEELPVTVGTELWTTVRVWHEADRRWRVLGTRRFFAERPIGFSGLDAPVLLSPDGRLVAAAQDAPRNADSLLVWDLETTNGWVIPCRGLTGMRFSPDSQSVLLIGSDLHLYRIRPRSGGPADLALEGTYRIQQAGQPSRCSAEFTSDGRTVLMADGNICQALDGRDLHKRGWVNVPGVTEKVVSVSADERTAALAEREWGTCIRFLDLATGRVVNPVPGHWGEVKELAVSPDGRRLLSKADDETSLVWDLVPRRVTPGRGAVAEIRYRGTPTHALPLGESFAEARFVSPQAILVWRGRIAAQQDLPPLPILWTVGPGRPRAVGPLPIAADAPWAASPDGTEIIGGYGADTIGGYGADTIVRYDLRDASPVEPDLPRVAADVAALAYTADGKYVRVVRPFRKDTLIDLGTGKPVPAGPPGGLRERYRVERHVAGRELFVSDAAGPSPARVLPEVGPDGEAAAVESPYRKSLCRVSAAGRLVAYPVPDGLRLLDLDSGEAVADVRPNGMTPTAAAFLPSGDFLAVGYEDGQILLWDLRPTGLRELPTREQAIRYWDDLGRDVGRARGAEAVFRRHPSVALAVFRDRIQPLRIPAAEIADRVSKLNDPRWAVREAAERWLRERREEAGPALFRAHAKPASPEAAERIQRLLAPPGPVRSPEILRILRAVAVLERIPGPEADELLKKVAAGDGLPAVRALDALARRGK
jgi:WD40 repeat protein